MEISPYGRDKDFAVAEFALSEVEAFIRNVRKGIRSVKPTHYTDCLTPDLHIGSGR